jgi:hypothetical protein
MSNTFHENGWGYQGGVLFFDVFNVKNLFLQAEYNHVSEPSYRSPVGSTKNQSWSHLQQPLAFTQGYGDELVLISDFKMRRIFANIKYHYQVVPNEGDYFYTTQILNCKVGFLINPAYNLNVCLGYTYRNQNFTNFSSWSNQTNYIYVGVKSSLYNLYSDF